MKIISKKIFLLTFALILTVGCIKSKKQDRSGLESLVINNILNGTASDKYNNLIHLLCLEWLLVQVITIILLLEEEGGY